MILFDEKNNLKRIIVILPVFALAFFSMPQFSEAVNKDPEFNPNNLISDSEMLDYKSMALQEIESFLASRNGVLKNYACHLTEREIITENGEIECFDYLDSGIHLDPSSGNNNSEQVKKLQNFLKSLYPEVQETGVYNSVVISAVKKFQEKYAEEILAYWGLTKGTGYVGNTTIKKINELYCEKLNKFSYPGANVGQNGTEKVWQCYFLSNPPEAKEGDGEEITVAEVIYNLSQEYKINPKFILVTLQKEQGLISNSNLSQGLDYALDWAMGYGCLERLKTAERRKLYEGFYNQIDGALWNIRRWFDYPERYIGRFQKGGSYTLTDAVNGATNVVPASRATAFLYRYTPHVYNGNYNFWKFWREYFGDTKISNNNSQNKTAKYPDGSLLKVKNSADVWLIENGKKRKLNVLSEEFSALNFNWGNIIEISQSDLNLYGTGNIIKYGPDSSLLKEPGSKVYFIDHGRKRWISSAQLFNKLEYSWSDVKETTKEELESILNGELMLYPDGSLIKENSPAVFLIENKKRREIASASLFNKFGYKWENILEVSNKELTSYFLGKPMPYPDGSLIKEKNQPVVWLIENGKKRKFFSGDLFNKLNYRWGDIIELSASAIKSYSQGRPVFWPDGTLIKTSNSDKVYLMEDGKADWIKTIEEFVQCGYKMVDVVIISEEEMSAANK